MVVKLIHPSPRLSYENEKAREQVERHKRRLSDLIKQQQQLAHTITTNSTTPTTDSKEDTEDAGNSSELQILADDRLKELNELQAKYEHTAKVNSSLHFSHILIFYVVR